MKQHLLEFDIAKAICIVRSDRITDQSLTNAKGGKVQ